MGRAATPQVEPTSTASVEAVEDSLVPSPAAVGNGGAIPSNGVAGRLPVELEVTIPLRDFRVRDLLALGPGVVVESQWANGEDVPLGSADVQLAWSEFEVVDTQLAVRLTRLV